jgi:general secretion pathway protein H
MGRRGGTRGFTLIELLIVIAILAVLAAASMPALSAVTGANARAAAGELAGVSRYLFETATMRHQTCRLALDIDNSTWWCECTKDKWFAPRDEREAQRAADDEELASRFPDERDAEKRRLLARARFGQFSDRLAKKRTLPGSVQLSEVWAEHQREPATKGVAYVYFFASGQAEAARIPLVDGANVYSVVTQPFTGHAKVVSGKPEVKR